MSWIDVSIVLIFIGSILSGFRRGLVLTLTSLLSFFASVLVANFFYRDLARYIIERTSLYKNMNSLFSSGMGNSLLGSDTWMSGKVVDNIPSGAQGYITQMVNGNSLNITSGMDDIITTGFIHIISYIVIFMSVRLVLYILARSVDALAKLPVLNFFNKAGGAFIGIIQGVVVNLVVVTIIYTVAMVGSHEGLVNSLNNSVIAPYFYIGYVFY
ncbi:hypothetical protein GC105_05830 [Alkalibaculum sp. M08DMB]|uniref:CvpA family protein n=1 Tax=Alkalibaculum sporogenes TaxID=2655001 RepID=A0A6A7K7I9_9FIRM|nr:CvpA family protein [Alkalibaculum sporogenes]MPW25302.1 hypothetical protein [Alkalibaculum sporogenes]